MFRRNPLPMWIRDRFSLEFLDANDAVEREFGYDRDEFIRMGALGIRPPSEHQRIREFFEAQQSGRVAMEAFAEHGIFVYRARNGNLFEMEISTAEIEFGEQPAILIAGRNVTARLDAERALRQSEDRLRELARRLVTIREEERAELSRTIHDELGQSLTALKIDLSVLARDLSKEQQARLEAASAGIDRILSAVRDIATELRPGILDQLGLVAAMEWMTREFARRSGLPCRFIPPAIDPALSSEQTISLFRILQEALTNVSRHANASTVLVTLESDQTGLRMAVEDDGIGLAGSRKTDRRSLGLLGMEERARSIGAQLRFSASSAGRGTRVFIDLPLTGVPDAANLGSGKG